MYPSSPGVLPAPFGATVCTQLPVEFCREAAKSAHSGRTLPPSAMYRPAVNLAGASAGTGGEYWGLPSMCSCQLAIAPDVDGWRAGTMALA
jgi:hypothetical protein